jgi:hypothetical protein
VISALGGAAIAEWRIKKRIAAMVSKRAEKAAG